MVSVPLGISRTLVTQRTVTARHGAVRWDSARLGFVIQGFFLHVAEVSAALDMACLAPTSTVAHAGVVVHLDSPPCGFAGVTGHAEKRCATLQRGLGNVIARLARSGAAVMATRTVGRHGERVVVDLGTAPGAGGFVATLTLRDADVGGVIGLGRLAKGRRTVAVGATRDR